MCLICMILMILWSFRYLWFVEELRSSRIATLVFGELGKSLYLAFEDKQLSVIVNSPTAFWRNWGWESKFHFLYNIIIRIMCVCILHTEAYCILYTVYRKDNPKSHDVSLLLVSFYKFQADEGRADEGAGCEWRCRREETLTLHGWKTMRYDDRCWQRVIGDQITCTTMGDERWQKMKKERKEDGRLWKTVNNEDEELCFWKTAAGWK